VITGIEKSLQPFPPHFTKKMNFTEKQQNPYDNPILQVNTPKREVQQIFDE
jgi:hypothetical protein